MANEFKRIGLWGRFSEPSVAEPARQLARYLLGRGLTVCAADGQGELDATPGVNYVAAEQLGAEIDLLMAIGGDGNLLRATRHLAGLSVPLIGVNRGRLGFLTDVKPDQMLAAVDSILDGDYFAEERAMLTATLPRADSGPLQLDALNDVVLQRIASGRILDFETMVDGVYVNTHGADGLIVATPTGSTAYALSCGGPIIRPDVAAMVMVPICPHTLSDRPIVLKSSSRISVSLPAGADGRALATCDGEELGVLDAGDTLEIATASESVSLLHPKDYNYYDLLRSKLNWGRANRVAH